MRPFVDYPVVVACMRSSSSSHVHLVDDLADPGGAPASGPWQRVGNQSARGLSSGQPPFDVDLLEGTAQIRCALHDGGSRRVVPFALCLVSELVAH